MDVSTSIPITINSLQVHNVPFPGAHRERTACTAFRKVQCHDAKYLCAARCHRCRFYRTNTNHGINPTPSLLKSELHISFLLSLLSPKQILGSEETKASDQQDSPRCIGLRSWMIKELIWTVLLGCLHR